MAWIWAILSAFVFLNFLQKYLTKKKKLPPGPKGLPILGHLHLLAENLHHVLGDLARKHGPIMGMRFGFVPVVIVSSPAAAELILKTYDHVFANRPNLYAINYVTYGQRGITFCPYSPYLQDMRKLCTMELLSNSRMNQFQATRKAEVGLLVESLKQAAERHATVDLATKIYGVIGDMNCRMVFGRKFADSDLDEIGFKAVITEGMELAAKFNLGDYYPFLGLLDLQGMNRKLKWFSKVFDGFMERILGDHIQKKQRMEDEDFVDIMLNIMESNKAKFQFDRRHVKAVLLDMFVAGMEASGTRVEWALSELIRHPEVMKKVQKELESVVGLDHMVEESHLDKLEYLNSVVKETQRLHPSVPLLLPRESMEECMVDGFYIQKKSRILVNIWAIGQDPNVWPNPQMFSPERFVGADIDFRGRDFQLLQFGFGRRGCPGMELGLRLVKFVLAQLVHCFEFDLPNCMNPGDLDMTEHLV